MEREERKKGNNVQSKVERERGSTEGKKKKNIKEKSRDGGWRKRSTDEEGVSCKQHQQATE